MEFVFYGECKKPHNAMLNISSTQGGVAIMKANGSPATGEDFGSLSDQIRVKDSYTNSFNNYLTTNLNK
jgi:hypothetical protein